jgi:hypothetical protein
MGQPTHFDQVLFVRIKPLTAWENPTVQLKLAIQEAGMQRPRP